MSSKTEEDSCAELRRVMHMETIEEVTQELEILNLSTEGSQQELHQRLLRFHLNESFSDVVRMPINLSYGTISQINFKLAIDDAYFDWVTVNNGGKTINVNMKLDDRKQPIGGESECETCRIYFQNPTDTSHHNTEEEKSENNDKELIDYQLSCLNLLRAWILCNPHVKDETPTDFLGNLTDFRKFTKMDDEILLRMLPCVLWPSIKSWYRTKNFNSWQEFEMSFLEEYGSKQFGFPKSSDSTTETTSSDQATTKAEVGRSDCFNDEIIDKLSAISVSQSIQQEKRPDKTEQESRWECIKKLKLLGLKFSGQKGLVAVMFMDDLNDFRSYTGINDRALLDVLPSILDMGTKIWYRANKFTSWQDFETSFVAGFKFNLSPDISATIIQPKPANLTAVSRSLHSNANNSIIVNDSCTIFKSLCQAMMPERFNPNNVLRMQKSSIPSQLNHTNNLLPASSQPTAMPGYSTNTCGNCGIKNCFCSSSVFPYNSQLNQSSSQPSMTHNVLNCSPFNNTLPSVSMTSRIHNAGNKLFHNQKTSDLSVITTAASTVNPGPINWTCYTM